MNKYWSIGWTFCIVLGFTACNSQKIAYKKAYEKAKEREVAEQKREYNSYTQTPVVTQTPVATTPVVTTPVVTETKPVQQQTYQQPVQQQTYQQPVQQQTYQQPVQQPVYQQTTTAQQMAYQQPAQRPAATTPPAPTAQSYSAPQPAKPAVAQTQTQQPTTPIVSGNGKYQLVDGTPLKMYSVACGAFGSQANAQNLFRELSQYGYAATIVLDLSKNMYRVLAMTSDNRADADQAKASLAEKYPTAWILINK